MPQYMGDRPIWLLTNQRWDNPDPHLISTLTNQTLVRLWGNLVGPTWGCLTRPDLDTSTYLSNGLVSISKCVFGYAWDSLAGGSAELEGGPVTYDPDRSIQAISTVYIDPTWESDPTGVWLWFKRNEGKAEVDMRAYRPTSTEDVAATATQYNEWVDFVALPVAQMPHASINEDQGWFRFARIPNGSWTAGVPDIELISFWDGWYLRDKALGMTGLNTFGKFMFDPPTASATSNTRHGLAQLLQAILNQLAIILNSDNTRDNETEANASVGQEITDYQWRNLPPRGLKQLDTDLATIEAADLDTRLTAAEADIVSLEAPRVTWCAKIDSSGNIISQTPANYATVDSGSFGGGHMEIVFDSGVTAGKRVDYTQTAFVQVEGHEFRVSRAYWVSQYVLHITIMDSNDHDYYNTGLYVQTVGEYA